MPGLTLSGTIGSGVRAYLDSCIAIYVVEGRKSLQQGIRDMLRIARVEIVVSDMVRLECRVKPLREQSAATLSKYERFLLSATYAPLTRDVYELATDYRAHYRLRTSDAIHLAAAVVDRCDEFWTNDQVFLDLPVATHIRIIGGDLAP